MKLEGQKKKGHMAQQPTPDRQACRDQPKLELLRACLAVPHDRKNCTNLINI